MNFDEKRGSQHFSIAYYITDCMFQIITSIVSFKECIRFSCQIHTKSTLFFHNT